MVGAGVLLRHGMIPGIQPAPAINPREGAMPLLRVKKAEKDSPGEDVTKDVDAVAKDLAALKKAASDLLSSIADIEKDIAALQKG
jgi:hypothetical protein